MIAAPRLRALAPIFLVAAFGAALSVSPASAQKAGGTITVASVQGDKYYLAEGPSAFEDGTLDYLAIPAVEIGLQFIEAIGLDVIHKRVRCLTGWLLEQLVSLK